MYSQENKKRGFCSDRYFLHKKQKKKMDEKTFINQNSINQTENQQILKSNCFFKKMVINTEANFNSLPSDSSLIVERCSRVNFEEILKEEKKILNTTTQKNFVKYSPLFRNYYNIKPVLKK